MHTSATRSRYEPSAVPHSRTPTGTAGFGASQGGSAPQQSAAVPVSRPLTEGSRDKPVRRLMTSMSTRAVHPPIQPPSELVSHRLAQIRRPLLRRRSNDRWDVTRVLVYCALRQGYGERWHTTCLSHAGCTAGRALESACFICVPKHECPWRIHQPSGLICSNAH